MPIRIIAHRGASAHAPENTLAAFRRALSDGADWIELDLQLTADHQVVVYHDDTLDRLTDAVGAVRDYTLDQLTRLQVTSPVAGGKTDTICSLDDVLGSLGDDIPLYLELKSTGRDDPSRAHLLKLVDARLSVDSPHLLASFDPDLVRDCLTRGRRAALIVDELRSIDAWSDSEISQLHALSLRADLASPMWRQRCDDAGIALWVWTVDERDHFLRCTTLGVDAICTNQVARAREFLTGYSA